MEIKIGPVSLQISFYFSLFLRCQFKHLMVTSILASEIERLKVLDSMKNLDLFIFAFRVRFIDF